MASDPSLAHIWVQLGHARWESGQLDDAAEAYRRAVDLDRSDVETQIFLARLYKQQGKADLATERYRSVLELDPGLSEAKAHLSTPNQPARAPLKPHLPVGMTLAQAQEKLDSLPFHHGMDFGDGLVAKSAAPVDYVQNFADGLFGNVDLAGRSMLDIGAWTGAYSFAAKRRGAKRVVASDHYVWNHPQFRGREAFDFARTLTGLDIETRDIDVPDITPASMGMFDAVLFSGVFYHLLDPIRLTQQISGCATHLLILETHEDALDNPRPAMIYYPGATLNGDATNFWGPNPQCVYELLAEFGFADIWYRKTPGFSDRGIYHAFRDVRSREAMGWSAGEASISLSDPAGRAALFKPSV